MTDFQFKVAIMGARTLEDFQRIGHARGYKEGWAYRKYGQHLDRQEALRKELTSMAERLRRIVWVPK